MFHIRRPVLALCFIAAAFAAAALPAAHAATHSQVMFSRYLKYQFCLEKSYGQGFDKKLGLDLVMNRWGASEPTPASLSKTSAAVQKVEAKCRADNELGLEPRPR